MIMRNDHKYNIKQRRSEQLDVSDLDNYLISLLHIESLFLYFPRSIQQFLPTIRNLFLPAITTIEQQSSPLGYITPACKALGIQISSSSASPRRRILVYYFFISVLLPEIYRLAKSRWILQRGRRLLESQRIVQQQQQQQGDGDNINNDIIQTTIQQVAQQRRNLLIERFFQAIDTIIPIVRLGFLLKCWSYGTTPPNLGLVLSGLRYQSSNNNNNNKPQEQQQRQRQLQVIYAHRRWLHHEVTRLLPMIGNPILNSMKETREMFYEIYTQYIYQRINVSSRILHRSNNIIRRSAARIWTGLSNNNNSIESDNITNDDEEEQGGRIQVGTVGRRCPICHQDPVLVPYKTEPCGHIYCYTCLWLSVSMRKQQQQQQHAGNYYTNEDEVIVSYCSVCQMKITKCIPIT